MQLEETLPHILKITKRSGEGARRFEYLMFKDLRFLSVYLRMDFGELDTGFGHKFFYVLLALSQLFATLEAAVRRTFDRFNKRVQQLRALFGLFL